MSIDAREPGGEARAVPCLRLVKSQHIDVGAVLEVVTAWPDLVQREFLGEVQRQSLRSEFAREARSILEAL